MNDLISRQAAIRWVKTECNPYGKPTLDFESGKKVIEHLEQMPSAQANSKELSFTRNALDTISRQAAIDALKEHRALYCDNTPDTFSKLSYAEKSRVDELDMAISTLVNLPSVQPQRGRGKWLCSDDLYETAVCSCCGWDTTEPWQHIKSWFEFCPHCGADMRVAERQE